MTTTNFFPTATVREFPKIENSQTDKSGVTQVHLGIFSIIIGAANALYVETAAAECEERRNKRGNMSTSVVAVF
jgi:hypothetical protein